MNSTPAVPVVHPHEWTCPLDQETAVNLRPCICSKPSMYELHCTDFDFVQHVCLYCYRDGDFQCPSCSQKLPPPLERPPLETSLSRIVNVQGSNCEVECANCFVSSFVSHGNIKDANLVCGNCKKQMTCFE